VVVAAELRLHQGLPYLLGLHTQLPLALEELELQAQTEMTETIPFFQLLPQLVAVVAVAEHLVVRLVLEDLVALAAVDAVDFKGLCTPQAEEQALLVKDMLVAAVTGAVTLTDTAVAAAALERSEILTHLALAVTEFNLL
jgi:hypothetical protein